MNKRLFPALVLLLAGCSDTDPVVPPGTPVIERVDVQLNPNNVLSTRVTVEAMNASHARVWYGTGPDSMQSTPLVPVTGKTTRITTLGLRPSTPVSHVVEIVGDQESARSDTATVSTGSLPPELQAFELTPIQGASTGGYTLIGLDGHPYIAAFDGAGRIVWYSRVDGYDRADFGQKPNGNLAVFVGSSRGFDPVYGYYAEVTPAGDQVARYQAPAPLYTDGHEILFTDVENELPTVHFFSYDFRRTDLTALGGPPNARLAGHQLLRMRGGVVEYMWNAWDHFEVEDWIEEPASLFNCDPVCDFDHPNSLDFDHDGHYIASFRGMAEITKIDSRSGQIIWRLGGRNSDFTLVDGSSGLAWFNGQHSVRVMENGNLLLYDNGLRHEPPESRAVEYSLDLEAMQATVVWEFRHTPKIYTPFRGSAQRLANGNTVIGWSSAGRVTEVDAAEQLVYEGYLFEGNDLGSFYRALRIASLYEFEAP